MVLGNKLRAVGNQNVALINTDNPISLNKFWTQALLELLLYLRKHNTLIIILQCQNLNLRKK